MLLRWTHAESRVAETPMNTALLDASGRSAPPRQSKLQLGRPVRHPGARPQRPHRPRIGVRLAAGRAARHRRVGGPAGALSARVLRPRPRRPHRRPRRGLEGTGVVGQLRLEPELAHRGRAGQTQRHHPLPAAARSAGGVKGRATGQRLRSGNLLRVARFGCVATAGAVDNSRATAAAGRPGRRAGTQSIYWL